MRVPEGVQPVKDFDIQRYKGTWYEIARLDHSFERGLSKGIATYTLQEDGSVKVMNRGFDAKKNAWREAVGKAKFVNDPQTGHLKVSFWGPFYGSYIIFDLDPDYNHAFICGYNKDYLWLLARTPQVSDDLKKRFVAKAKSLGFKTEALLWPAQ